jgi:hypothetical protein
VDIQKEISEFLDEYIKIPVNGPAFIWEMSLSNLYGVPERKKDFASMYTQ